MSTEKVLVLNATGKVGRNVCRALFEAGYEVYGTTRADQGALAALGAKAVVCNYTVRADLDRAFAQTGATKVFVITDYFRAARKSADLEFEQGRAAIDAAKAAGVDHLVFMSVADAEFFDRHVKHLHTRGVSENSARRAHSRGLVSLSRALRQRRENRPWGLSEHPAACNGCSAPDSDLSA